jgi:hypothetical protein
VRQAASQQSNICNLKQELPRRPPVPSTMVEILTCPYDQDVIPMVWVEASIVTIDDELSHDSLIAQPVSQPISPASTVFSRETEESPPRQQEEPTREQSNVQDGGSAVGSSSEPKAEEYEQQRRVGAGVAGAVFGLFLAGPLGAIILGLVTMSYTKKEGAAGDTARGLGDVALVAREKAKEINDKHHIVDKSKYAAAEAMGRLKKTKRSEELKEKSKRFFRMCFQHVADYARRRRLVERGSEKLRILVDKLAENLNQTLENRDRVTDATSS